MIRLDQDKEIVVGALGKVPFKRGFYLYVGSAKNGLKNRISRHLKKEKKKHWHIDYLLEHGDIVDVKVKLGGSEEECLLAKKVRDFTEPIPDFGSSDCRCKAHLFYHPQSLSELNKNIKRILDIDNYS